MGTEMDTSGNRTALGVSSDVAQLVGERLRRAREAIGRSTSILSAKIKVREHYLVAIENGEWDELPPGLNGRGLVRIYARELSVSVPELDQGANQAVMPAEQDAQAPYQVGPNKESRTDREFGAQRVQPAAEPAIVRAAEMPARTNALKSATVKQKSSLETSPANRAPTTNVGAKTSARIGLTPEEQPIDVTTPDVASILGISLDMFDEPSVTKNPSQPTSRDRGEDKRNTPVPRRGHSEEEVLPITAAESIVTPDETPVSGSQSEPTVHSQEASKTSGKLSNRKGAKKHSRANDHIVHPEAESVGGDDSSTQAAPVISAPLEPTPAVTAATNEPVASVANPSEELATSAPTESGVSAAEAYLKSHASADRATETTEGSDVVVSSKLRWAVGLLAACVGVLIVGRMLLSEPQPIAPDESALIVQPSEPTETSPVEAPAEGTNDAQVALNPALSNEPVTPENLQAPNVVDSSITETESSPEQVVDAGGEVNTGTAAGVSDTSIDSEEPSVVENSAIDTLASSANAVSSLQGASAAVLKLTEPVEIQLTVDGARIFNGRHEAGDIDLKFEKRLEIFVQDGSKAVLNYSGWNHGALGQSGRKRRIVLNSASFE
jgi:cytoskeletal protein RodZ